MKSFNFFLLGISILLSTSGICAQVVKVTPIQPTGDLSGSVKLPEVREELLQRLKADQDARKESATKKQEGTSASIIESKTDADNAAWIKHVIEKHGWPGKSLVGVDGAQAAFVLIQHAARDSEFQKKCLELLEKAVKQGEAPAVYLAFLTDRVRMVGGKPQVYGTQTKVTADGKFEVYPIEDEANVDKRRAEVGLEPLATYIERMRQRYSKPN